MGLLLLTALVMEMPPKLVSESEVQAIAASFARALWGETQPAGYRLCEDVHGQPAAYLCEELLQNGARVLIAVGARADLPPILFYHPPDTTRARDADPVTKIAIHTLGQHDVRQIALVYYSPFDIWSEYEAGQERIMVSLRTLEVCEPAKVRNAEPLACNSELVPVFAQQKATLLSGAVIGGQAGHRWISSVPDWDWHYGCAPTAAANVLAYWDLKGYDLLIDSILRNMPDRFEKDLDSVPNISHQLAIAMNTDTVHSGNTATESIPLGIQAVCSDPVWGNCYNFTSYLTWRGKELVKNEVDSGRPGVLVVIGHPEYGNHALTYCGWGPPSSDWIMVHDEWAGTPRDRVIYYDFGGRVAVVPVVPSEPVPEQPEPSDSVSTFPNPVRKVLNIAGRHGPGIAEVYDSAGRWVMRCAVTESGQINVSGLSAGAYVLRLDWRDSAPATGRFVVTSQNHGR